MRASSVKRTLTAIVVADVVGYSRLMGEDEAGTLRRLTQYRSEIIDATVARFRGRIVNSVGDSLLLEFDSVVEAALCAIALQKALAERNLPLAPSKRLMFRMGVNIGDVIVQERTLFGDGVNVAARLQTLSEPGGLCLSSSAHEQIAGKIDAAFRDMGAHQVKNISREVFAFGLSAEAIANMEEPTPPTVGRSRKWIAASIGALALVAAFALGANYMLQRSKTREFSARMNAILSTTQAKLNDRSREKILSDYLAIKPHRAFAIAPKAQSHWWTGDWATTEIGVQKVLERCQLAFDEPCQLIAADEDLAPGSGPNAPPATDLTNLSYSGDFDPAHIPGIRQIVADRADVAGYIHAPEPKAAAIHPRGLIAIVTGASSQRRAESQALKLCNDDDAAKDGDGPCYLYAQGNKVVLPQRRTTAMTPP